MGITNGKYIKYSMDLETGNRPTKEDTNYGK